MQSESLSLKPCHKLPPTRQWRKEWSTKENKLVAPWCKHFSCCSWQIGTSQNEETSKSDQQSYPLSSYDWLKASVCQSVSQMVENLSCFSISQQFSRINLKTVLNLQPMPPTCHDLNYIGLVLGCQETLKLHDPYLLLQVVDTYQRVVLNYPKPTISYFILLYKDDSGQNLSNHCTQH